MAEKRKPTYTILLRKEGKKKNGKLELFRGDLFKKGLVKNGKWRIRVNGKWYPAGKIVFYNKTEIRKLFFNYID